MTTSEELTPHLHQRGRASVDFICNLVRGSGKLRETLKQDIAETIPDIAALPDDLDERDTVLVDTLSQLPSWRVSQLISEWHSQMHGIVSREAYEEIADELKPVLEKYQTGGPATLETAPEGSEAPAYWDGVDFHRTAGGWDGHEAQGYIHGEIVHRKLVEALYPGGIFKQREQIAAMPPKDSYARILDIGASTGHFTTALQKVYPDAQITGIDPSLRALEQAQRVANANGWAWKLHQRAGEDTGFDDASFDLVTSYILLHEMPADPIRAMFREVFRVLVPGGDMIMADVTRYADMDKLAVWNADFGARLGGEPYWRESASLDLAEVAREAGFVDVTTQGIYPHIVQGRKPE